jgi:hypothetical protein
MRMNSDTNTNSKAETKNAKLKIWDSKVRKTNRNTKMGSMKHGEGGRKGGQAGRKKKDTKIGIAARTYYESKTKAAMKDVRIPITSHIFYIPHFTNLLDTAPKSSSN